MPAPRTPSRNWRPTPEAVLSLILLAALLVIGGAGRRYYVRQQRAVEQAAESELSAVADLKAAEIANWRGERLADANQVLETELVKSTAQEFLADPANQQARAQLLDWMTVFHRHSHFGRIVLLDSKLQARLAMPENEGWVGPLAARFAAAALQTNRVLISDLHLSQVSGRANMDYLVPVVRPSAPAGRASAAGGVFLLEIEPTGFLFPNIQTWPTPSPTAETLLGRREGDEVVYLNELRHRTNTALKLRFPLTNAPNVAAARAVLGEEGVIHGLDYRQQPVLAALRHIPDSPWFLVAKRDEAEINGPLRKEAWIISQLILALVLAGTLGVFLVWRNREFRFSRQEIEQRKRTEEELRQSEERFRSFTAATFEGICVSEQGRILDFNDQFSAMFGCERAEIMGREILTLIAPESSAVVADALRTNRETVYEHQLVRRDGTVFAAEARAKMSLWWGRKVRVTALRDITERKRAEAELKQTQAALLEASRLAGKAEVATSVLHNVGNVLNSVNVSTSLVSDKLRQSKIDKLARVAALMQEQGANLGDFLTRDPKGQQVPVYLRHLAEYLIEEQSALLKELGCLKSNVEHIRDIVIVQQGYAKMVGGTETVPLADLVEDALRLNAASLDRHEVRVIREYVPELLPRVTVEKNKVLQILVNLIRNAKYACDESGRADRTLTVRASNGGDQVRIAVADNGVGIPAANLAKIFNHGFTTRKEGHGFGLHGSRLAATEMGGALHAQSDGPGQGATFTLELPAVKTSQ